VGAPEGTRLVGGAANAFFLAANVEAADGGSLLAVLYRDSNMLRAEATSWDMMRERQWLHVRVSPNEENPSHGRNSTPGKVAKHTHRPGGNHVGGPLLGF
jgi:hypothetical protein